MVILSCYVCVGDYLRTSTGSCCFHGNVVQKQKCDCFAVLLGLISLLLGLYSFRKRLLEIAQWVQKKKAFWNLSIFVSMLNAEKRVKKKKKQQQEEFWCSKIVFPI